MINGVAAVECGESGHQRLSLEVQDLIRCHARYGPKMHARYDPEVLRHGVHPRKPNQNPKDREGPL